MSDHTPQQNDVSTNSPSPSNERTDRSDSTALQRAPLDRFIWWSFRISFVTIIISVAAMIVILALRDNAPPDRARHSGEALVKSEFSLVDHLGRRVTHKDFAGKWQLVFFGFTYCPDVCPTTLVSMGQVIDALGDAADKVVPLFITVDPQRDTPQALAEYVTAIHPNIIALTGTPEEIKAAAQSFRIYYAKVDKEDAPDGYLMNHSGFIYLMTPKGDYEAVFTEKSDPPAKIAAAIKQRL